MVYENIDPNGPYTLRINGRGQGALYVNQTKVAPVGGESEETLANLAPSARSRATPEFTEFQIPQSLLKTRRIVVDWRDPAQPPSTSALRFGAYVAEVWLLKK